MHRRSLLRIGTAIGAAGIAGCGSLPGDQASGTGHHPVASLRMLPVTDAEITERVYGRIAADTSERAAIVRDAVANGTATFEERRPPLRDGERVVFEETLYEMSMTVENREPAMVYPIVLENLTHENVTPAPGADRRRFENLPDIDRTVFREHHLAEGKTLGVGTNFVYTDAEAERSVLVPPSGYTIIEWESGARGQFSLRQDSHDTQLSTYRYTVETITESAGAYGRELRDKYVLGLSEVPEGEADILRTATTSADGHQVPHGSTPTESFQSLANRFQGARDITDGERTGGGEVEDEQGQGQDRTQRSGTYLVRFDAQVYWTRLFLTQSDGN